MYNVVTAKPKKSVKLTDREVASLRVKVGKYPTKTAASIGLGVGREVLLYTLMRGTCSEETYNKLFS